MWDVGTLTAIGGLILGIPAAALGIADGLDRFRTWQNDLKHQKLLGKDPTGPQDFYVKTTHIKYIMREEWTELTKVRTLRTLKDVEDIEIDQFPTVTGKNSVDDQWADVKTDFFSIPGVALKNGAHFLIHLAPDQVFKAKENPSYVLSYEIRQPLNGLHDNPEKDFLRILKPLGRDNLVVEVHFPPTRSLRKNDDREPMLEVYEVRGSGEQLVAPGWYQVCDAGPIESFPGVRTDRFRLVFPHPPQDADIKIYWYWQIKQREVLPSGSDRSEIGVTH